MSASQQFTDFVLLVKEMRKAQKKYFKDRTQSALKESKALEKKVDDVASEITARYLQKDLFEKS